MDLIAAAAEAVCLGEGKGGWATRNHDLHPEAPSPLGERVGVRGTKIKYIYIPNHYHPPPWPSPKL